MQKEWRKKRLFLVVVVFAVVSGLYFCYRSGQVGLIRLIELTLAIVGGQWLKLQRINESSSLFSWPKSLQATFL